MRPATAASPGSARTCIGTEFVDTNVLLYAHDADTGVKQEKARLLIERLFDEGAGAISFQVLSEFCSVAIRKWKMPAEYAEQVCVDYSGWHLHYPHFADLLVACELHSRYRISWYDALVLNSAIQLRCTTLWTEDFSHGQEFGSLTVRDPFRA